MTSSRYIAQFTDPEAAMEDGFGSLANGKLRGGMSRELAFGRVGCAWRGSITCTKCPLAAGIAKLCDYACWKCADQAACPCGQDGQDLTVDALLGVN
jgi:hypothetical protein